MNFDEKMEKRFGPVEPEAPIMATLEVRTDRQLSALHFIAVMLIVNAFFLLLILLALTHRSMP